MNTDDNWRTLRRLVITVMRGNRPMTVAEIIRAIYRRFGVKTDERSVRAVLMSSGFAPMRPRFRFLQRSVRWELVEAGPADDPGTAGAPVPAKPFLQRLSGATAAELTFREEEPPTDAIGRAVWLSSGNGAGRVKCANQAAQFRWCDTIASLWLATELINSYSRLGARPRSQLRLQHLGQRYEQITRTGSIRPPVNRLRVTGPGVTSAVAQGSLDLGNAAPRRGGLARKAGSQGGLHADAVHPAVLAQGGAAVVKRDPNNRWPQGHRELWRARAVLARIDENATGP
jgi:hypothetical protein